MRIAYFDEAGDDGLPGSSPVFTLSALYMHHLLWRQNYERVKAFRQALKVRYGLPATVEIHSKELLLNKNPYRHFGIEDAHRVAIVQDCCDLLATLKLRIVNVSIVKERVVDAEYNILDNALTYAVQRIENHLRKLKESSPPRFMIITDSGRVGKMTSTTRRIQRINYIPSRFGKGSYRREIATLLEDPLPKDSKQSYFIQLADIAGTIAYMYTMVKLGHDRFSKRMPAEVTPERVLDWMDRLKPVLNTAASRNDPFGVVVYPGPVKAEGGH